MQTTRYYAGVTLYGDYQDLRILYNTIYYLADIDVAHRTPRLSDYLRGLCYDIRHAYEGRCEKRAVSNGEEKTLYYGVKILYPTLFFQYKTLRWLAGFTPTTSHHQSNLYCLQASIESSLKEINPSLADECMALLAINEGITTDYLITFIHHLETQYAKMNKKERKENIAIILRAMWPLSEEYREFRDWMHAEAKKLNKPPHILDIQDEDIDIRW